MPAGSAKPRNAVGTRMCLGQHRRTSIALQLCCSANDLRIIDSELNPAALVGVFVSGLPHSAVIKEIGFRYRALKEEALPAPPCGQASVPDVTTKLKSKLANAILGVAGLRAAAAGGFVGSWDASWAESSNSARLHWTRAVRVTQ